MIEYATLSNISSFQDNPIIGQHQLRYEAITKRQGWDILSHDGMEFDQYDNPAAKYLVYKDDNGKVTGCSRFYPTSLPYMLEETFPDYVSKIKIPKDKLIWEGSRFCIDKSLCVDERLKAAQSIVLAYLELALLHNVKAIVGLMYPAYWRRLFVMNGWDIKFIGEVLRTDEGHKAQAAWLPVNEEILQRVKQKTGIEQAIINLGVINDSHQKRAA